MKSGVYQIKNLVTGDIYIGQSSCMPKRKSKHFRNLLKGIHDNKHLQNSYNKYGESCFSFSVLVWCEPFELTRYEQGLVDRLQPEYNKRLICVNGQRGVKHSEESKRKMSITMKKYPVPERVWRMAQKANIGRPLSEEHKQKMRERQLKFRHTEESKKKISLAQIGRAPTNKGKKQSVETRQKISNWNNQRWADPENRRRQSEAIKLSWIKRKHDQENSSSSIG